MKIIDIVTNSRRRGIFLLKMLLKAVDEFARRNGTDTSVRPYFFYWVLRDELLIESKLAEEIEGREVAMEIRI